MEWRIDDRESSLDQRSSETIRQRYSAGRTVLNTFSYTGAFFGLQQRWEAPLKRPAWTLPTLSLEED